jgi:hypothetical protein
MEIFGAVFIIKIKYRSCAYEQLSDLLLENLSEISESVYVVVAAA